MSTISTKRCRLCLGVGPEMKEYHDDITEPKLLEYINEFLKKIKLTELTNITFQCSYTCDVFDNTYESTDVKFTQSIGDLEFIYTINGFAQVTYSNATFAHNTVLETLSALQIKNNFIGVGGESLLYGIAGKFENITVYTNSSGVHQDNLLNRERKVDQIINCHLVDYETFELPKMGTPSICVANVSRNGIRQTLCSKLDQMYVRDIIGVYCSEVYERDLKFLKNYYIDTVKTNGIIHIVHFKRIPIISLGNNCCIAYQLQKLKLREMRFPFDWLRYKKTDQLIICLENKFTDFEIAVSQKKPTGVFPIVRDKFPESDFEVSDSIFTNCYGMAFPHDKKEDLQKYPVRIARMANIQLADYVLDCDATPEQIEKLKSLLPNARHIIKLNYEKIHSPDWTKSYLNWLDIFSKVQV